MSRHLSFTPHDSKPLSVGFVLAPHRQALLSFETTQRRSRTMGDVHEADLEFENTDAGASTTYPTEAGKVRKGGHLVIRGRPCKARFLTTVLRSVSISCSMYLCLWHWGEHRGCCVGFFARLLSLSAGRCSSVCRVHVA